MSEVDQEYGEDDVNLIDDADAPAEADTNDDEDGAEQSLLGFQIVRGLTECQRLVGRGGGLELFGE